MIVKLLPGISQSLKEIRELLTRCWDKKSWRGDMVCFILQLDGVASSISNHTWTMGSHEGRKPLNGQHVSWKSQRSWFHFELGLWWKRSLGLWWKSRFHQRSWIYLRFPLILAVSLRWPTDASVTPGHAAFKNGFDLVVCCGVLCPDSSRGRPKFYLDPRYIHKWLRNSWPPIYCVHNIYVYI